MADLISREAAVNAVRALLMDGENTAEPVWATDVLFNLANVPAVEAVPLEPLAELLDDLYGGPCLYSRGEDKCIEIVGDKCNPEWIGQECWTHFLRAWMKQRGAEE